MKKKGDERKMLKGGPGMSEEAGNGGGRIGRNQGIRRGRR